ncbi:MAG: metallophosphoesterase [Alphaproteobacteria bacterium]|nr:metallophosphoesterase [Alphaproteobacteria bacterium]
MITRRRFLGTIGGVAATGFSTAAYGVAVEPACLAVTHYHPTPRQWPSDFPLRIAVLSDLHVCDPWMSLARVAGIVARTNALRPDVVVLLGDYAAGHHRVTGFIPASEWAAVLATLRAPLGVYAVLGNHDYWVDLALQKAGRGKPAIQRAMEAAGIPVLVNSTVRLNKEGRAFWLAGLGDQMAFAPAWRRGVVSRSGIDDLNGTLARVRDKAPVILLAHEPFIAPRVPSRVALQLSGHTHGGQVRLFGWAPALRGQMGADFAYGHFPAREVETLRHQGRDRKERAALRCDLVVSGGLGCSILPVRLGVPPEIVLVTVGEAASAEG